MSTPSEILALASEHLRRAVVLYREGGSFVIPSRAHTTRSSKPGGHSSKPKASWVGGKRA